MSHLFMRAVSMVLFVSLVGVPLRAHTSQSPDASVAVAAVLAQGWAALAQGNLSQASAAARRALAESPRSSAAVALAVEIGIVRAGSLSGLDAYESWLNTRRVDEPYVLRRIAT